MKEIANGKEPLTYSPEDLADESEYIQEAIAHLELEIEEAYADVPFSGPRNAGIAGFWREVGGRL